jgi:hypothetical protein
LKNYFCYIYDSNSAKKRNITTWKALPDFLHQGEFSPFYLPDLKYESKSLLFRMLLDNMTIGYVIGESFWLLSEIVLKASG